MDWDEHAPEGGWGSALVLRDISRLILDGFRGRAGSRDPGAPAMVKLRVKQRSRHASICGGSQSYRISIVSTATIPAFIVPVILASTTSTLPVAFGSAARSARFFNASAALVLPV